MLQVCSLQSGSQGNCTYVASATTKILIDAGISGRKTAKALAEIDVDFKDIDAVLITHEHADHCGNARTLSKQIGMPVFITQLSYQARINQLRHLRHVEHFLNGDSWRIGDIDIQSVPLPHDAADTTGFVLNTDDTRFGIFTDLGMVPGTVKKHIEDLDILIFESNYDEHMLATGPYPEDLKARITANTGHISNQTAADVLHDHLSPRTKILMLAHLSGENNSPEIALQTTQATLQTRTDLPDLTIHLTDRKAPTDLHIIN